MYIYHITKNTEWKSCLPKGEYLPTNFNSDGFIHCSFKDQVIGVANSYYKNADDLVLLKIDTDLVKARIVEENLEGGKENFPHIYGSLTVNSVIKVAPLIKNPDGHFFFPMQLD